MYANNTSLTWNWKNLALRHQEASMYSGELQLSRGTYLPYVHDTLLEVTKQQICIKYCSSVLYYQLQGSWSNVGHCANLWFTSNKATALFPTNLLHVPDRTCNIYLQFNKIYQHDLYMALCRFGTSDVPIGYLQKHSCFWQSFPGFCLYRIAGKFGGHYIWRNGKKCPFFSYWRIFNLAKSS